MTPPVPTQSTKDTNARLAPLTLTPTPLPVRNAIPIAETPNSFSHRIYANPGRHTPPRGV